MRKKDEGLVTKKVEKYRVSFMRVAQDSWLDWLHGFAV